MNAALLARLRELAEDATTKGGTPRMDAATALLVTRLLDDIDLAKRGWPHAPDCAVSIGFSRDCTCP